MSGSKKLFLVLSLALAAQYASAEQSLTGSWAFKGPGNSGMWLKTYQKNRVVNFELEIHQGKPSNNTGWVAGIFEVNGSVGAFKAELDGYLCEIGFRFLSDRVVITQKGDLSGCGFGHNVFANGTLKRKSHKPPQFCGDAKHSVDCIE